MHSIMILSTCVDLFFQFLDWIRVGVARAPCLQFFMVLQPVTEKVRNAVESALVSHFGFFGGSMGPFHLCWLTLVG